MVMLDVEKDTEGRREGGMEVEFKGGVIALDHEEESKTSVPRKGMSGQALMSL